MSGTWSRAGRAGAPARAAGRGLGDVIVVRLDATIMIAHSDDDGQGHVQGHLGFHPLTASWDNAGESLAVDSGPATQGAILPRITLPWSTQRWRSPGPVQAQGAVHLRRRRAAVPWSITSPR